MTPSLPETFPIHATPSATTGPATPPPMRWTPGWLWWLLAFGLLLRVLLSDAAAQAIIARSVTVDTNGVLIAPTNFWTANASQFAGGVNVTTLSNALQSTLTSNTIALTNLVYTNGINLTNYVATKQSLQFLITTQGTNAQVGPGTLVWSDGSSTVFPGGSVALPYPTNYLVLNLGTLRLHSLWRFIGDGELLLGRVLVSGGVATGIIQPTRFVPPANPLVATKRAIISGQAMVVSENGDSTTAGVPTWSGTNVVMWSAYLFNSNNAAAGLNVANAALVTQYNNGVGGTTSEYGLAQIGDAYANAANASDAKLGYGWAGTANELASFVPSPDAFAISGTSSFYNQRPTLVTVGFGVNGGNYNYPCIEAIARRLGPGPGNAGYEVLLLTQNEANDSSYSKAGIGYSERLIADGIPSVAVADTEAYVDEAKANGQSVFIDSIHGNPIAQAAWAEAVLGVLNPYPQATRTVALAPRRIISTAVASEAPYFGFSADFVGGVPAANSGATLVTTASLASNTNAIPACFGYANTNMGYQVNAGGSIDYGHHCFNWVALLFRRGVGGSFTATVNWIDDAGGLTPMNTISYTDSAGGDYPGIADAGSITQLLPAMSKLQTNNYASGVQYWVSGGVRVSVTSGTAYILGVIFGGPRHLDLPGYLQPGAMLGTWAQDTGDTVGFIPSFLYSDTPGSSLFFPFTGRAFGVWIRRTTATGFISFLGDNSYVAKAQNFGTAGRPPWMLQYFPGIGGSDGVLGPSASHQAVLQLTATNAAPGPGSHAVNIYKLAVFP